MHTLRVHKKYGCSHDSSHHLLYSLLIPLTTYSTLVWGVVSCHDKYLSKIDKFPVRAVRFGFLKEATPVLSFLKASDN